MSLHRTWIFALLLAAACLLPISPDLFWKHKSPAFAQTPRAREGMVRVPAGEFAMGNDEGAQHEKPKHKALLDSYYIESA
jgi:formylglycine-generating enzyme required for sulfatase activity